MVDKHLRIFDRPFALSMGPQRAGTSWLDRYLRTRGDICLPSEVKEVFYFDRDYNRGTAHYTAHFKPIQDYRLIMEISTTSFDHIDAPARVYDTLGPDIKLLCPLRHPVLRSYSLYLHYKRYGLVSGTLREACKQNPQILESSHYAENLERWMKYYPLNKIHFVYQEQLEADQEEYIHQVCAALDIPYIPAPEDVKERYNVTTYSNSGVIATLAQHTADWLRQRRIYFIINFAKKLGLKELIFGKENPDAKRGGIPEAEHKWLTERLLPEVKKLEELLGREITEWK
ncbi:MAG: hypothetical protein CL565_05190 [Alphaproteobacteria bacterium]|nr:hypothetical protein [Alphaproteobacteria bacterium]|tara:strand:- start:258 stop:1115 length:858 start_codon:yes stop_codon:yes gene_type:complete